MDSTTCDQLFAGKQCTGMQLQPFVVCINDSSVNPGRRLADVGNSAGITLDDLPHVQAWMKRIEERVAVRRGIDVPEPFDKAAMQDPKKVQEAIDMVRKFTGTHKSEL